MVSHGLLIPNWELPNAPLIPSVGFLYRGREPLLDVTAGVTEAADAACTDNRSPGWNSIGLGSGNCQGYRMGSCLSECV